MIQDMVGGIDVGQFCPNCAVLGRKVKPAGMPSLPAQQVANELTLHVSEWLKTDHQGRALAGIDQARGAQPLTKPGISIQ